MAPSRSWKRRARYFFDLFEMAQVSCLALGENGVIVEANLTAHAMLGAFKGGLVGEPFP